MCQCLRKCNTRRPPRWRRGCRGHCPSEQQTVTLPSSPHLNMAAWDRSSVLPFPHNIDPSHVADHICTQNHVPAPVSRKIISTFRWTIRHSWPQQSLVIALGLGSGLVHLARWGQLEVAKSMDSPESKSLTYGKFADVTFVTLQPALRPTKTRHLHSSPGLPPV